jgi:hypothetical protein
MSRSRFRLAGSGLAVAGVLLAAGCGTSPATPGPPASRAARPDAFLNTSVTSAGGTWAVTVMGGSDARYNDFWQLFTRPAGSSAWKLVTPPGTADNGGLVIALSGSAVFTAFRPSQDLTYTPLIQSTSGGRHWASINPIDSALASAPGALAARPGGGLLALVTGDTATMTGPGYSTWKKLVSRKVLAATSTGRLCGLTAITAAAFTSSGSPLLAGACARPGHTGIFMQAGGSWRAIGPAVPAALAGQRVTVLRLVQAGSETTAVMQAGTGPAASLLVAWSSDDGGHWSLSPALAVGTSPVASASFGPDGAVAITGHRGELVSPGRGWRALPPLPPGTVTLAAGPGKGTVDALAVHRVILEVWQTAIGATTWTKSQTIKVAVPFGSSS